MTLNHFCFNKTRSSLLCVCMCVFICKPEIPISLLIIILLIQRDDIFSKLKIFVLRPHMQHIHAGFTHMHQLKLSRRSITTCAQYPIKTKCSQTDKRYHTQQTGALLSVQMYILNKIWGKMNPFPLLLLLNANWVLH